jgi:hypothetical protein
MGHDRRSSDPLSRTRRRTLLALPLALSLAGVLAACAAPAEAAPVLLQVQVVDRDTGRLLPMWRDHGQPVVPGRAGARYSLRLTNLTGERLLAVVAIDGVNVVTGETASPAQRGYVFEPGQGYDISGWRKSDQEVAAFEFTSLSDSYAARTGRPLDVGVIGVAVFREAAPTVAVAPVAPTYAEPARPSTPPGANAARGAGSLAGTAAPAEARRDAAPPPAADAAVPSPALAKVAPRERLGTGHGAREDSYVTRVGFERATTSPEQLVRIRYDSWQHLVDAGIIPRRFAPAPVPPGPRAFPADPDAGYVPDPPAR